MISQTVFFCFRIACLSGKALASYFGTMVLKNLLTILIIVVINTWMCLTTTETLQVLRKSMKGLGTDDTTLVRVIVTRTEIDMQYIKVEYLKKYKKTLNDAVHSETSGHYRTFLLSLLGPNH